ncbi:putative quinol monooxygenase [Vibrio bivalvicida]|uniref:Antibiotic biosynthesis monooxygenase n=1 Tax=Vibrio bivalvicida TaxID=1276888 RepID=A0A177XWX6_9VIBR|nr:putative quinol monooxygenase [Vibrio bivalvicida]OAJ93068.1 antibiotic biosynthesis monooxygenase [Vibrio bivalvicida]
MINLTAKFQANTGQEATLEKYLVSMLAPTRSEPGCLKYTLLRDKANPSIFVFQEQFASQAAFDAHCDQPYFHDLLQKLDGLLIEEPEICFYDELAES